MLVLWTSVSIILHIYVSLQVKQLIRKQCQLWIDSPLMTDSRNKLQKWTLLAGSHSYKAWIAVVLYSLSFGNYVAFHALDFDTPVSWTRHFSDSLGVCSSLASNSSNFSSVSTWHLCSCFFIDPSLLTKLWNASLLETLSLWNVHSHFLTSPYFTEM
jgi:nitrate/nitrite transporter NarK